MADSDIDVDIINVTSCTEEYSLNDSIGPNVACPADWDGLYCWPSTPAGVLLEIPCQEVFAAFSSEAITLTEGYMAYRECDVDGNWLWGNWTNYTECMNLLRTTENGSPLTVSYIVFVGSVISFICLIISLFIFSYFKSLQCSRIRVHRNLIISLILHSVIMIIIALPGMFEDVIESFHNSDWFCKAVLTLKMYSAMTCIYWMFVEGHLLHSSITVSVFGNETSFVWYYAVGWGIPFLFVLIWLIIMSCVLETKCWAGYGKSHFIWFITLPMIIALLVNSFFLVNIIRILITKLKMSASLEMKQVKKAIKATALLFPLLGITHLLFCINPRDDAFLEQAYMITNALLQSSQGLFVALLYCFLNSEVQAVLMKAYMRSSMRRNPGKSYGRSHALGSMTNTTALSQSYEQVNGSPLSKDKHLPNLESVKEEMPILEKETSFIN